VSRLSLVEYTPALAPHFRDINAAWIEDMYVMEDHDRELLDDPDTHIVAPGGVILFAALDGRIVGTGALMPAGGNALELTKMGVLAEARGHGAGDVLMRALVERARAMAPACFYLLTNRKSAAAIHLYERHGFVHDADIMARFGASYDRCDVAMSHPLA
jgi:ribosomal protein S18 acetylase RimI-like enzyme